MGKLLVFLVAKCLIKPKWFFLGFYYNRLAIQAKFLYRQSDLFRFRWQALGLAYAEESLEKNSGDAQFFFNKAKKEPRRIRWQIFWDGLLGREPQAYYLEED